MTNLNVSGQCRFIKSEQLSDYFKVDTPLQISKLHERIFQRILKKKNHYISSSVSLKKAPSSPGTYTINIMN